MAAAICLKTVNGEVQVLLVRTLSGQYWQFPGGELQPGEMPFETAARELKAATGYVGHAKRAPVAHREMGGEVSFILVRDAKPVTEGEPRRRPGWFHLGCAVEALKRNRTEEEFEALASALATAIHWFYLQ